MARQGAVAAGRHDTPASPRLTLEQRARPRRRGRHWSVVCEGERATVFESGTTRLPRAARRAQIIDTAAGAFLRAGFDGTSMDDVAEAAGISRLLIYRIFETKEQLYRAVLSTVTDEMIAEFEDLDLA